MGFFKKKPFQDKIDLLNFTKGLFKVNRNSKINDKDYIDSLPTEKREQVHLFKIIFTSFFIPGFVGIFVGFYFNKLLLVISIEAALALIGFVLFKIKPKVIQYPNCFLMPVFSFLICFFMAIVSFFGIGNDIYWIGRYKREGKVLTTQETNTDTSSKENLTLDTLEVNHD